MKTNETRTASRIYYTTSQNGIWYAHYQPINLKTGKPWQARRGITAGRNCYRLSNWHTDTSTDITIGTLPSFEVWTTVDGGMNCCEYGYSTEALAIAAIENEKKRSGK